MNYLEKNLSYPTAFLCTIGQPHPRDDLQPVKATIAINNNNNDICLIFFIIILNLKKLYSTVLSNTSDPAVLIAPLDWGLGHATRCIPLINYLLQLGCKVIIAAVGPQKKLLKNEFPNVSFVDIPSYNIKYTKGKRFFVLKIILQIPKILIIILSEKKWLKNFLKYNQIDAVISDNRYGLYHYKITTVFITHQLCIKASFLFWEKIIQKINYRYIKKFSFCWIPDVEGPISMAGALSHPAALPQIPVKYIGGISRLERQPATEEKYNVLIILSGPEPQRTLLERKLLSQLKSFKGKAFLLRGLPGNQESLPDQNNLVIKDHLPAKQLEKVINESEIIISRSGYTTVMDICKLKKKSILIPTPGQTEQEYLAVHLQRQKWCLAETQENFYLEKMLQKAKDFKYEMPDVEMEAFKEVLDSFMNDLRKN